MRRLAPTARKLTLTVHVAAGVGWLGVHAVLILLAVLGLTTGDRTLLDAVYVTAGEVVWLVFPFAVISLVSGVVLAVGDLGPRILVGSTAGFVLLVTATALSVWRPRSRPRLRS